MTALTVPRLTKQLAERTRRTFPVAANVVCWQGGIVVLSAATLAQPATVASTLKSVGVAIATADNRGGLASAISVTVDVGVFLFNNDGVDPVTRADIGNTVYLSDDNTVSKTNGGGTKSAAGTLFDLDPSGGVWVTFL